MLGLVNYADEVDGASLGLVSYAGNGTLDVEAWLDELGFAHASLRMGSRHLYTIYDYEPIRKNF